MESSSALAASPSVNSPPANGGSIDSSPIRFADVLVVSEALRELALVPKQPPGLDEPKASLVDRRFLMQPSKVKFIVQKRSEPLRKLGLEFRMEPGCVTVQDFVDRTRLASLGTAECDAAGRRGNMERPTGKIRFGSTRGGHASGSESLAGDRTDDEAEMCDVARCVSVNGRGRADELGGNACETDPEDGAGKLRSEVDPEPGSGTTVDRHRARDEAEGSLRKEGGRGEAGRRGVANDACPASDAGAWQPSRGMTMVYNTSQGWVYLHSVTEESVKLFERIESGIECEEYGIPAYAMSPDGLRAVRGMARLFSEGSNVTVSIEECIVRIAGTAQAVEDASRALEAVTRSTERTERLNGHWFWRGDPTGAEDRGVFPTYPMSLEVCHRLDQAYARYLEDGSTCATYMINGSCYEANFTTMIQRNLSSNRKRPIERLVPHRTEFPLARCPKQTISVTCFREGTAYSMVGVSKREEALVKSAVAQSMSLAVTKVEHIWNSFLWGHYAQNAQNIGNEMMLFHGAGSSALSQISRTGFDRRFAGCENGASFGLGCYFARDASYASRYALVSGGRQMIMAKVLVGRYTCGSPTMKRPPKVSPAGSRTYDSTVNDQHMPTIFVTYKDWQAYPMYLISFAGTSFPTR